MNVNYMHFNLLGRYNHLIILTYLCIYLSIICTVKSTNYRKYNILNSCKTEKKIKYHRLLTIQNTV